MEIKTVGVVGCGLMGSGIAQISAQAGLTTIVREVNEDALAKGRGRIEKFLGKAVAKGKATEGAPRIQSEYLIPSTRLLSARASNRAPGKAYGDGRTLMAPTVSCNAANQAAAH